MKKACTGILVFIWLVPLLVLAQQQHTISGVVQDTQGQPIIGANVFIKGSYDGTSSGPDGTYSFTATATGKQIAVASFLGYEPQEQSAELKSAEAKIDFKLKEKFNQLNAVTITAGAFKEQPGINMPTRSLKTGSAAAKRKQRL